MLSWDVQGCVQSQYAATLKVVQLWNIHTVTGLVEPEEFWKENGDKNILQQILNSIYLHVTVW